MSEGLAFTPGDDPFDMRFAQKVARALNDPYTQIELLKLFKEYMVQYLALNQPPIPISQVFGFTGFTPEPSTIVAAHEATGSTSYTDLATAGPSLTGLPGGRYAIWFGASMQTNGSVAEARMSLSVNGAAADENDRINSQVTAIASCSRLLVKDLTSASNSLTAKYRVTDAATTATFGLRWIVAAKYSNL